MKKFILFSAFAFVFHIPVQGQFLKKLQQKVSQQVEDVVTNKVAAKAATQTESYVDRLLDGSLENYGIPGGMEMADPAAVPAVYEFDHFYDTRINTGNDSLFLRYLLKKDAPYFGMKMGSPEGMYVVIDPSRNLTVMYMNSEDANFLTATTMPSIEEEQLPETEANERFTYKKIDNKTILGYNCKGFQAEDEEAVYTFYITGQAGISFQDIYKNQKVNLPAAIDPTWLEEGEDLMMQMKVENKKNSKNNMVMTCVGIEKDSFSLFKKDYAAITGN